MKKSWIIHAHLSSWHLLGSFSSYMVNFKILLRYRGNQHSANTITRQKTVFATSNLLKRKDDQFHSRCYTKNILKNVPKKKCNNLLGVVAQRILSVLQHFPGHECVEDGGPSQRHAKVEAEEPPVLCWFIKLLIEHDMRPTVGQRHTHDMMFNGCYVTHMHIYIHKDT